MLIKGKLSICKASTVDHPNKGLPKVTPAKSYFYDWKPEASESDPCKALQVFYSLLNPLFPPTTIFSSFFPTTLLFFYLCVTFFAVKVNRICQSFSSVSIPSIRPHPLSLNALTCFSSLSTADVLQLLKTSNATICLLNPITSTLL